MCIKNESISHKRSIYIDIEVYSNERNNKERLISSIKRTSGDR